MKEKNELRKKIKNATRDAFADFFQNSGMTRQELAAILGISYHNFNRILDAKTSQSIGLPTTSHIWQLAQKAPSIAQFCAVDPMLRPVNWVLIASGARTTPYEDFLLGRLGSLLKEHNIAKARISDLDATIRVREEQHTQERKLLLARIRDLEQKLSNRASRN